MTMTSNLRVAVPCVLLAGIAVAYLPTAGDEDAEGPIAAQAENLRRTVVSAHLDVPLEKGKNVLWCGTFQLCWNELCMLVGEDVNFTGKEPPEVALLNRKSFVRGDLDDASYVAIADYVRNGVHARIRAELLKKFHGEAEPHHIPPESLTPRPQDIVSYCYLFKKLDFPKPFERLDEPLRFENADVPCFGIGPGHKRGHADLYPQVVILHYAGPDEFAVELKAKSKEDRLLLARLPAKATLRKAIEEVQDRAAHAKPRTAAPGDILKVPKLNFDITRTFTELERLHLDVKNPDVAKDLVILSAVQGIRFLLNEKGVRLRSEAHIALGCSAEGPPPSSRRMIFDKPFLLLMQRADAKMPYFAMWVDNAEIILPSGQEAGR
jgi:hypothetical protein